MGIVFNGYTAECDNCGRKNVLASLSRMEAECLCMIQGWAIKEELAFCSDACRRENAGEICRHVWPRSGPNAFVCRKCGVHRDDLEA